MEVSHLKKIKDDTAGDMAFKRKNSEFLNENVSFTFIGIKIKPLFKKIII